MNKLILCLLLSFIPMMSFCQDGILDISLEDSLRKAIDLNTSAKYLRAARVLESAKRELDADLTAHNATTASLDSYEFESIYWPIKKSLAEVAYMLGNYTVANRIAEELTKVMDVRDFSDENIEKVNGWRADIAKIEANSYYLTEKYDSAEAKLKEALRLVYYDVSDEDFRPKVLADMAQLYYKERCYDKALAYLDSVVSSKYYTSNMSFDRQKKADELREFRSQRAIVLARLGKYDDALKEIELVLIYYKSKGINYLRNYGETLRKKAKILMLRYDSIGIYSPTAKSYYQEYLSIARQYVDRNFLNMDESQREQYWMAEQPFVTDCYRLEGKAPELLYDVALFSKAILLQMGRANLSSLPIEQRKRALASMHVTWQQVQKAMPENSTAIEFIAYDKGGKDFVGALVLNKTGRPVFIPLFSKDSLLNEETNYGYRVRDALTSTSQATVDALYTDSLLYDKIWNSQLVKAIGKSPKVFFCPDGIFYQLAIEYMVPKVLSEKKFYRLTSTRLLTEPRRKVRTDKMLMSGYINYHADNEEEGNADNDGMAYSLMTSKHMDLPVLDNSKTELDSINEVRSKERQDTILEWDDATEYAVRQLMNKYHIVLLSTHGYFSEATTSGTDIRPASSDTQLSKSCLFFTGAVSNMINPNFDAGRPDGILSARELSNMDLGNIDLAVLSACQTGLGFITPDGVYGLQRGLKAAGVKAVIASLWSVSDKSTSILMTNLFRNLENGMGLNDAFNKARIQLKDTKTIIKLYNILRRRISYDKPYYYNSFIIIDGLE